MRLLSAKSVPHFMCRAKEALEGGGGLGCPVFGGLHLWTWEHGGEASRGLPLPSEVPLSSSCDSFRSLFGLVVVSLC